MKQRQFDILQKILQEACSINEIISEFKVSKRTAYYDINEINKEIKDFGKIENFDKKFVYVGDTCIYKKMNVNVDYSYDIEQRQMHILEKILGDEFTTIEEESEKLLVSKSTVFNDIKLIKESLEEEKISLIFDKKYDLIGDEYLIRDYYIKYMYFDLNLVNCIDERILKINKKANLYLTDYSISLLSKFLTFTEKRIKHGKTIGKKDLYKDVVNFDYYELVKEVLGFENEQEVKYFVAFISSLTKLSNNNIEKNIETFVSELIENFEKLTAISIRNKEEFSKEISRHLQSSYYRLKFKFPIYNALLNDIKKDYMFLLKIVEESVKSTNNKVFSEMREQEIAFLAMYFGARIKSFTSYERRVVIVCPNGKVVSKMLESQLYNYLPTIKIVGVVSIYELENVKETYDYIISTVNLEGYDNIILVKPILTSYNIMELYQNLLNINSMIYEQDIDKIIEIVDVNAKIKNKEKLKIDLIDYFINKNKKRGFTNNVIKLSDLVKENRIKKIRSVEGYEEAIKKASQVLLNEKSINKKYIDDMLNNIEKFGSYFVITKDVALPHANNDKSVNKMDVSILSVEEKFDIKGKEVGLVIVICPVDNNKHLKMLGTITDILEKQENINILKRASYQEIIDLIKTYEDKDFY